MNNASKNTNQLIKLLSKIKTKQTEKKQQLKTQGHSDIKKQSKKVKKKENGTKCKAIGKIITNTVASTTVMPCIAQK